MIIPLKVDLLSWLNILVYLEGELIQEGWILQAALRSGRGGYPKRHSAAPR